MKKTKETKNAIVHISFEKDLSELESIVAKMEKGELKLEESLQYFEQGIALTRRCQKALQEAEQKVKILTEQSTTAKLKDFIPTEQQGEDVPDDES
jgi:exodeoxyribonuclease VII small subunit